jgi:hypothetical protein
MLKRVVARIIAHASACNHKLLNTPDDPNNLTPLHLDTYSGQHGNIGDTSSVSTFQLARVGNYIKNVYDFDKYAFYLTKSIDEKTINTKLDDLEQYEEEEESGYESTHNLCSGTCEVC